MNTNLKLTLLFCAIALSVSGCSKGTESTSATVSTDSANVTAVQPDKKLPQAVDAEVQPAPPSMSTSADQEVKETEGDWVGVVVSTIDVQESKTMYIELDADGQRQWVASQAMELQPGDKVRVGAGAMEMENFASSSLGRTFERLWLASEVAKVN